MRTTMIAGAGRNRVLAALAAALTLCLAAPTAASAQADQSVSGVTATGARGGGTREAAANPAGGYFVVNGLPMYYEVHGTGRPLVLLHGALSTIDTDFGRMLPAFARDRRVIAVEQQAHGHTADVDRPLSYEAMADETAALLRHLDVDGADLFGYSMGAGVAMQLAIRHPELVRKLVLAAPAFSRDGFHPGLLEGIAQLQPEHLAGSPFQQAYARTAPKPEDWPALIGKVKRMDMEFQGWPAAAVGSIQAPSLVVVGDADIVRPEHAVQLFRLLGGGVAGDVTGLPRSRMAMLPGTTHVTLVHRADWLVSMVSELLDAPAPRAR